jgi:hypothetical protein
VDGAVCPSPEPIFFFFFKGRKKVHANVTQQASDAKQQVTMQQQTTHKGPHQYRRVDAERSIAECGRTKNDAAWSKIHNCRPLVSEGYLPADNKRLTTAIDHRFFDLKHELRVDGKAHWRCRKCRTAVLLATSDTDALWENGANSTIKSIIQNAMTIV